MLFDPLYMLVMFVGFALSGLASLWVKTTVNRYSQVPTREGMTGAQVAQAILDAEGIHDVRIERVGGFLSDHYDPSSRTLRLSPDIYGGRSVAAAGIAAHEVGHALQHARGMVLMQVRQALVPVANIGTQLGVWITIAGIFLQRTGLSAVGVALFGGFVAFTLVTLPIELDASWRAGRTLDRHKLLTASELSGVHAVLTAAAATYLAAALTAILQLLYWASRAGLLGGRRDD